MSDRIIDERTAEVLRSKFKKELKDPVSLILFVGRRNKEYCDAAIKLLRELSDLSSLLTLEIREDDGEARTPVVLVDPDRYSIRYIGYPGGYEAWAFVETICLASRQDPGISPDALKKLNLRSKLRLVTFVTPECPHCPHQVLLMNKLAVAFPKIVEAECVESYENPDLAEKHGVTAVPHTLVIAREGMLLGTIVGAQPEDIVLGKIASMLSS